METAPKKKRRKIPLSKKTKQKRILMIGLGGGVVAGFGYLAYTFFKNKGVMSNHIPFPDTSINPLPNNNLSEFPLRSGAKGHLVAQLQNALIAKGGQAALIIKETSFKNGRVDGAFGRGTERALRAAGWPSVITPSQFNRLVGSSATTSEFNASGIAKEISTAADTKNLFGAINGLKKIQNTNQYKLVSSFLQGIRISGVRVSSLVNALLSVAFANKELEKIKIRAEFKRMGLKQNSKGVWFVPNLGSVIGAFNTANSRSNQEWNLAIAKRPTVLRSEDGALIIPQLQPQTVIGYITGMENGMTRILTQSGETVFAPSDNLKSL